MLFLHFVDPYRGRTTEFTDDLIAMEHGDISRRELCHANIVTSVSLCVFYINAASLLIRVFKRHFGSKLSFALIYVRVQVLLLHRPYAHEASLWAQHLLGRLLITLLPKNCQSQYLNRSYFLSHTLTSACPISPSQPSSDSGGRWRRYDAFCFLPSFSFESRKETLWYGYYRMHSSRGLLSIKCLSCNFFPDILSALSLPCLYFSLLSSSF